MSGFAPAGGSLSLSAGFGYCLHPRLSYVVHLRRTNSDARKEENLGQCAKNEFLELALRSVAADFKHPRGKEDERFRDDDGGAGG